MKQFLAKSLLAVVALLAAHSQAQSHHSDHPAVHGMLMVGTDRIYLSHLPMFHSPHDYQVIMEVEIPAGDKAVYLSEKNQSSETVYTVVPEVFVLPDMIAQPRPFKAKIYKGHFERGGQAIVAQTTVTIKKVVLNNKLIAVGSPLATGAIHIFGEGAEIFAAHLIGSKPNFDQVVELEPSPELAAAISAQGSETAVVLNATNGPLAVSTLVGSFPPVLPRGTVRLIDIKVKNLIYLEFGDLQI